MPDSGGTYRVRFPQLASQYTTVFDKLLDAYKQISEELPRIERLRRTFSKDEGFDRALGLVYGDIVDFHGRAYKFFRRRGIPTLPLAFRLNRLHMLTGAYASLADDV